MFTKIYDIFICLITEIKQIHLIQFKKMITDFKHTSGKTYTTQGKEL